MSPAICCMSSIGSPPANNFRLGHCYGPASLLDLLDNPKSSLSLNSSIYRSGKSVLIIPFPLRATRQNHAFSEVVPKGRPQKYLFAYLLSIVRMWLTPSPCGRPHLSLDTTLWS